MEKISLKEGREMELIDKYLKQLPFEVARFLNIEPKKVEIEDYIYLQEENELTINGYVDLGYLQLSFMACINPDEEDGYIVFQLQVANFVKIENEEEYQQNGSIDAWVFEIKNGKICGQYAKYGL